MKTLFLKLSFFSLTFFLLTLSACKTDPCENVLCLNGGQCADGACLCPAGVSGDNCEDVDQCFDVTCFNGGICFEGICLCEAGFSGADCSAEQRTVFFGEYDAEEICASVPTFTDYFIQPITTKPGVDKTQFYIGNIYNLENNLGAPTADARVVAYVTGDTSFEIPSQALSGNVSYLRVEGIGGGSLSGTSVAYQYIIIDTSVSPNDRDTCTTVLTPR